MSALRLVVLLQLASLGNSGLAECAAQDDQTECAVLLEIASLGVTATGWKGGGTYCDWTGITCNTVPNTAEELIFNEALQRRELTHLILNDQVRTSLLVRLFHNALCAETRWETYRQRLKVPEAQQAFSRE